MGAMNTLTDQNPAQTTDDTAATTSDRFGTNVGDRIEAQMDMTTLEEALYEPASHCNVGRTEQKFRIAAGTALLATAAFAPLSTGWRIGLAALGAAELITGTTRYCPVSKLLGVNTCRADER